MTTLLDHHGNPLVPQQQSSNIVPLFEDGLAGLVNQRTGVGTSIDRNVWDAWLFVPLRPEEIVAGYRSNWLLGKIVDVPAEDMVREWRDWQAEKGKIEALEEAEERFGIVSKVQQGIAYGRLGGGAILLGFGDERPDQPAPRVQKDSLRYLHLFSRYDLTLGEEETDITSPWYGQPKYFEINGTAARTRIHPSRIVPFKGAPVPRFPGVSWEDVYWGDSVIQRVDRAVKNAVKAHDGFARLIDEAKIDIFRLSGFMQNVISDEASVRKRVEYTNAGKSTLRGVYLDKEDEFIQRQLSLTGMPQMIETLFSVVAGAAEIPATKLLGRAPQGMNSTGEHDEKNYNTMIRSKQRLYLSPAVNRIDKALIPSALGDDTSDVGYIWAPLSVPTKKEQAETNKIKAETIEIYSNNGMVPSPVLEKATQSMLSDDQWLPGLDEALSDFESENREDDEGDEDDLLTEEERQARGGGQTSRAGGREPARRAAAQAGVTEE